MGAMPLWYLSSSTGLELFRKVSIEGFHNAELGLLSP